VEGLKTAIHYFERSTREDRNFALAYTGLADSYGLLGTNPYDAMPPKQAMPEARRAALKAVEIDSSLAEAHASLAYVKLVYDWDFAGAEKEFKHALALNAGYPTAHQWYAYYLTAMGHVDEALVENERARELDPLTLVINTQMEWDFYMARQYDRALEQCQRTLELNPDFFMTHYNAGQAYVQKRMYTEAISEFQKGESASGGSPIMLMGLSYASALAGKRSEAQKTLGEMKTLAKQRYVPALYFAAVYTGLGDRDEALRWLNRAVDDRSDYCIQLRVEPICDGLRPDPRFREVLARGGLPP
jgi:tetratricopeptide (TPR) repeat protein